VATRVITAMVQPVAAWSSAVLASEMPITMATEPVMIGGSTLSSAALPDRRISTPAMIDTAAVATMPPWATSLPPHSAPTTATTAAMYENEEP